MKKTLLALATLATCGTAAAAFTGTAAPGSWSVANVGTLNGSPSPGTALFTTTQLVMLGADSSNGCTGASYGFLGACELRVSLNQPGTYSFDWSYVSFDADGPGGDQFGVFVDGLRVAPSISDLGGAVSQAGNRSFVATSSFAFFLNCTDCTGGKATVTISNFTLAPIPEPSTLALWLAGGAAVAGWARRQRQRG